VTSTASRKIVVGIDPTKDPLDPLRLAGQLARLMRLPLVLVTAFPHHPLLDGPEDAEQLDARADAREELLGLGHTLEGVEIADAEVVASSSAARVLQHASEEADAAVIVVGSTTRGPLRRVLPGSVAERLLSGAAAPVAIAPHGHAEHGGQPLELVGVAFDGSEESVRALEAARALAERAGAALRIITVHEPVAFGSMPLTASPPAESVNSVVERELRGVHDVAVASQQGVGEVQSVFRSGSTVDVLLEQSREVGLLVAGSRGYGPLGAVLLGSTTRDVMRAAECPLLVTPRGRRLELGD
jgi:nucleotide-binding universal stress UspA family protein